MSERQKILIVDDRKANLVALRTILAELDVDIVEATNGNDALAATLDHHFAVAVLDVQMPGMGGYELAEHLRGDDATKVIPIVFVTASYPDEQHMFMGYDAGAIDYLSKPLDPKVLLGKVRILLELARYREELRCHRDSLQTVVADQTARLRHLNDILRAIRDVNQLIVREKQPDRLIQFACESLVSKRGCRAAWIMLTETGKSEVKTAQKGFGEDKIARLVEQTKQGCLPDCCSISHSNDGIAVIGCPGEFCGNCPMAAVDNDNAAMVMELRHEERRYGYMGVSIPAGFAADEEEESLMREIAGDIAFALHGIEAREKQRVSEERYRALVMQSADCLILHDLNGQIVDVNARSCTTYEYAREELLDLKVSDLDPEYDVHTDGGNLYTRMTPGVPVEFEACHRTKNGREFPVEIRISLVRIGGETLIQGLCRDVTAKKEAQRRLWESEHLLSFAIEQMPIPVMIASAPDVAITRYNQAVVDMLAVQPENIKDVPLAEQRVYWPTFYPDGRPCRVEDLPLTQAIREGKVTRGREIIIRQGERERWICASAAPLKDESGRIVAGIVVFPEITEQKKAAEALREGEAFLRTLLAAIPVPVFYKDAEGRFQGVNKAFEEFFGAGAEELVGKTAFDIGPPELAELYKAHDLKLIRDGGIQQYEAQAYTADGDVREVMFSKALIRNTEGKIEGIVGGLLDLTEYRKAETERQAIEVQFRQSQKLESIGRLAGGVAHDFNNLIMGIMNYTELCREELAPDHPVQQWLQEIIHEAKRTANLTRQLLAFARKQTIAPRVLDLNDCIAGMLKMLERLMGEDLDLCWQPAPELWRVKIDPGQVDQILANLCVNARDAITGVGKVTIETYNVYVNEEYARGNFEAEPGNYVVLSVSDDGCGMDQETREHIFEPFFTTKVAGEGTGLGLATVHGIVKQNTGFINVYSEPGEGTTFRIYLPSCEKSDVQKANSSAIIAPPRGGETILLVEDERSIRVTTAAFLAGLGYNMLVAESPTAALALVNEHNEIIDLLLTDVVMPGMSGRDLAEKLAEIYPDMRCLYMSGYTANVIAHRGILDEGVNFVSKPITRNELAKKVRDVLDV